MTPFDGLIGKYVLVHSMPTQWTGRLERVDMVGGAAWATISDAALWLGGSVQEMYEEQCCPSMWEAAAGGISRRETVVQITAASEIPGLRPG